jgi:hypothetical protein
MHTACRFFNQWRLTSCSRGDLGKLVVCYLLLAVTLLTAGCDAGCYNVDNVKWCKESGVVERRGDSIILHDSKEKTEMWGDVSSTDWDCIFGHGSREQGAA